MNKAERELFAKVVTQVRALTYVVMGLTTVMDAHASNLLIEQGRPEKIPELSAHGQELRDAIAWFLDATDDQA